jgi:hypothetical protein
VPTTRRSQVPRTVGCVETSGDVRVGVLIMRAWLEADEGDGIRVRVTATQTGRDVSPVRRAAATIDDACDLVRGWLEDFQHGSSNGDDGRRSSR